MLSRLVAAAKKKDDPRPVQSVVNAVSGAEVNANLENTFAHVAMVSEIPILRAVDAFAYSGASRSILESIEPFSKYVLAV